MEKRKEIPLFALSSIVGRIGSGLVSSLYNFTNEKNVVQYVIEINDYNKPLLNKYELRFASEKFTFDEIIAIGNEFKNFIPNKKILHSVDSANTSHMNPRIEKALNGMLNFTPDEIIKNFLKSKMKKRQIELTIETAERWYNGCDRELKELALQTFPELKKKKLPKSWEELKKITGYIVDNQSHIDPTHVCETIHANKNIFATKEQAEASVALAQLSQLREVYRNGWAPDWSDDEYKDCIIFVKDKIETSEARNINCFLSFEDPETRDLFLDNFRDLIKKAKPLMQ